MLLELLKDNLKTSKRALDVGCGSGYLSVMMA
jgi:ribosomal protein L11 methylase PrmA